MSPEPRSPKMVATSSRLALVPTRPVGRPDQGRPPTISPAHYNRSLKREAQDPPQAFRMATPQMKKQITAGLQERWPLEPEGGEVGTGGSGWGWPADHRAKQEQHSPGQGEDLPSSTTSSTRMIPKSLWMLSPTEELREDPGAAGGLSTKRLPGSGPAPAPFVTLERARLSQNHLRTYNLESILGDLRSKPDFYPIRLEVRSPGMGPGPRGPFQRAMSMDGKPPGGPGGAGRRPMLIKQENMMGSPDGYPGNMGAWFPRGLPYGVKIKARPVLVLWACRTPGPLMRPGMEYNNGKGIDVGTHVSRFQQCTEPGPCCSNSSSIWDPFMVLDQKPLYGQGYPDPPAMPMQSATGNPMQGQAWGRSHPEQLAVSGMGGMGAWGTSEPT
ncbi:nuclear receptor coactivator 3 isoform X1 [Lates japonicus]|uniref:Nuclear receptor coactivator 3 isoform X1 n=1 Tax=Lates japonicus TaxID=270547 RepID=A0AAD3R055_LATJO|nr:nuclear receptor coactivator 3 isoform X1 [Lates japonicus]